ncbi:MAG TPA: excinuclease ABC subunit UvrB [bacterium]|nr:excinuclease ABC subunit UvrB [bacterium]
MSNQFKLKSPYTPTGDQPQAIAQLVQGINKKQKFQTLKGVTGSGKTFAMANIIAQIQKPTLIIAHNKTLAAQLAQEFKEFFPENAVHYFVSYYDYYQPEAYIPSTDTYIEKDSSINEEIDKLRHAATSSLLLRQDVIVVASVSCIYGIGSPELYKKTSIPISRGQKINRNDLVRRLIDIQYQRNDIDYHRGTFRVRGDILEIWPPYENNGFMIDFFGNTIDSIKQIDGLTGEIMAVHESTMIFPAKHFVTAKEDIAAICDQIRADQKKEVSILQQQNKLIEAQRLEQRVNFDLEMIKETGYCNGIENYSRYFDHRRPGQAPNVLLDFFPKDYLMFIDESHITVPQIGAMFNGDKARKDMLTTHGFRLQAAYDNRPLNFAEFESKINQVIFTSATPSEYEKQHSKYMVEQIIRPTGLLDPPIEVRPATGQIDDLIAEIRSTVKAKHRVLVTTLTKRLAEELTEYLQEINIKVQYLHSDVDTVERIEILRDLRLGKYDVLVGINLLREGLDLPEVTLVAILDADKEGFLRSETALIQTIGRAARHVEGHVIMYADKITRSMQAAIDETNRRRDIQSAYNKEHDITPQTIESKIKEMGLTSKKSKEKQKRYGQPIDWEQIDEYTPDAIDRLIATKEKEMDLAARNLEFEKAAEIRDDVEELILIKKNKNRK